MKQATVAASRHPTLSFEDEAPSGVRRTAKRAPQPCVALSAVPRIALRGAELRALPLDHRAGFVLSRIDGCSTVETIIDVCAMPEGEALALLDELVACGILALEGGGPLVRRNSDVSWGWSSLR